MNRKVMLIALLTSLLLFTACNLPRNGEPTSTAEEGALRTSVAETVLAEAEGRITEELGITASPSSSPELPATETLTPTSTETFTPSPTFTITPSPTSSVPMVSVSVDTNCRSGPGVSYSGLGVLLVGETAEVVARAETGFYWVIKNPDSSGTCWLWAEYATVTGDTSGLLVMTAPPSPTPTFTMTPAMAFSVQYDNYHNCGGIIHMTFRVSNTGSIALESADVAVVQIAGLVSLFDGFTDVPFVGTASGCPPDLSVLAPGAVAYIAVPIGPAPAPPPNSGSHAATFNICSLNGLTGTCLLREINFTVP